MQAYAKHFFSADMPSYAVLAYEYQLTGVL